MHAELLRSYARTRCAMAMSPERLARHRARQWAALKPALARTPALAGFAEQPLDRFPIVEPADLRADYGRWNSLSLTDAELRAMADAAEAGEGGGPLSVGWSTGSAGGARGLFIADAVERADYIGQSLARLLPFRDLLRRQRLALHLRANSALYSDAGARRLAFKHLPLDQEVSATIAGLRAFAPTILIAPPHRLIAFADAGAAFPALRHLFYGSEPMSSAERAHVAERIGLEPRPIYQATEGFLGAGCRHGRLHLNDHALEIELEPVPGTPGFRPIITDLRRRSQPVVRLRGDDYLELEADACSCGFAGRVIAPVAGRVGDIWRLGDHAVPPGRIVAAIEGALGGIYRWQAIGSRREIQLRVAPDCPEDLHARAAERLAQEITNEMPIRRVRDLPAWTGPKRRKIVWSDG